ncbi:hypothetical protein KP77_28860 [Jeotgalibacillus alimentarius]|uniref:Uncharacterized protein n=1 Tax=Jeotgalibacillus alimentarius TaxID=135826 RepID=A0A0C2R320_9BACL|nr:hypothetical protein KP77_28860 [Jeotgalibacillus alimentarius]
MSMSLDSIRKKAVFITELMEKPQLKDGCGFSFKLNIF